MWDGVSNHQRLDCLFNGLFRHRSKITSTLRVIGLGNRRQRNNVVKFRKQSLKSYFGTHGINHDKNFWKVISPFTSDKPYKNGNSILLNEKDAIVYEPSQVAEIFNEFFTTAALALVLMTPWFLLMLPYMKRKIITASKKSPRVWWD